MSRNSKSVASSASAGAVSFNGKGVCPLAIYIDGTGFFIPGVSRDPDGPPDISSWSPDDFSAVEHYASGSEVPARFNTTQQGRGVLLLWRRYKR